MDREAWQATVYGVTKRRTRLSHEHFYRLYMTSAIKKHHVVCNRIIIKNWAKFLLLISRGKFYSFKNMGGKKAAEKIVNIGNS